MSDLNTDQVVFQVRSILLREKKPSYTTTNKKEVRVRCPYCGDSKSNKSSAHMYIEMRPPFRFHCFKCETAGRLTQQTAKDFGLYNNELNSLLVEGTKLIRSTQPVQMVTNKRDMFYDSFNTNQAQTSLNYFNNRYGCNLSEEYVTNKFKAVLSAPEFFKRNNIYASLNQYDFNNVIGFVSSDASHIVFRDTSGMQQRRYFNLNLCNIDDDVASKIYNISSDLDIMSDSVKLVITEGIFDIIGVYLHFYKDTPNEKNTIFAAACGKGFNTVITRFTRMGFLNLDVSIYSDADVGIDFYKNLKQSSPFLKNSRLNIFYNTIEKDFGVPLNRLNLKKAIV